MAFKIQCPGCDSKLKLAAAPAKDMKLKCPKCEKIIKVSGAPAAAAPPKKAAEPAAAPAPKVAAAGKAAAKAKASAKPTKAKASKATGKKRKRAPVNDDWDDYEDLGDDLDDFEDDFDNGADDFEEPQPKRGKKKKGAAAASKGKKAPAKSGGKGMKIALSVLLGVGLIGGTIYGVMQMMGGDDDTTTASTDGAPKPGSNQNQSNAGTDSASAAAPNADQSAASPTTSAAGQNVVNMQYLPKKIDFFVHAKLSAIMASPLFKQFEDKIPPQAMATGPVKPEDIESITFASWIPPQSSQAAAVNPNDFMVPAMQQGPPGGFGGMDQGGMGGPPGGFGQGGPPPGFGGGPGGPGQVEEYVLVLRMAKEFTAADFGTVKGTQSHNGQTIHEVTDPNSSQTNMMWIADNKTIVGGKIDQVKAAIDQGSNEWRFERFDFSGVGSSHLVLALAPRDPNVFKRPPSAPGMPPVQIPPTVTEGLKAACLHIEATDGVKLGVQIVCRDSSSATALHTDIQKGIEAGKKQLEAQATGMMAMLLRPVQKIVSRVTSSASGERITINADAMKEEITALSNSAGPFIGMAMSQGMGNGMQPGGPPGGMNPFGGAPAKDDVPFSEQEKTKEVSYEGDIAPILKWRCGSCHIDKNDGGLSLASYDTLMAHSSDKGKAVTPKEPDASSLLSYISSPPEGHPTIKESEVSSIRKWIEEGAGK